MRIIFMGTPDFAVPALRALADAGHDIVAVYSQPPRPAGRGKQPRASAVQQAAEELGVEVRTPASLKPDEEKAAFAALDVDVAVVAAYGLILNQTILDASKYGCLNIHASLLPRWRGAAPVQRAILAGDPATGVTIMQMERGLDTGPMLTVAATLVEDKTAGELTAELAAIGASLICDTLDELDTLEPQAQDDAEAIYADKIDKAEARLDFTQPAEQVERAVRAFNPMPGAFFEHEGERFKVLAADISGQSGDPGTVLDDALTIACGTGALRPTRVQRAGKAAMDTADLLRGLPIPAGTSLA
ncbi:methionyl-tRNA formyltransferase [Parasphingopyxis algicola]|uniref:methionyl-tRNA formyltransferase n=1 Tax=Parasphingopyxis algicola TaxID=2026624 RepID=UPI0015A2F985|nr:methionyl-tRNA formyltransferase [Parasphingopyxis algicola]QLC24102.1 methionyl-tRNA formyltransferase [Parasphingopyxis algicola]